MKSKYEPQITQPPDLLAWSINKTNNRIIKTESLEGNRAKEKTLNI